MNSTSDNFTLVEEIIKKKIFNPHSGYDVTDDEVYQYLSEARQRSVEPTVEGFRTWLKADVPWED